MENTENEVTAACERCGETIYLFGFIWPHANGLLLCDGAES